MAGRKIGVEMPVGEFTEVARSSERTSVGKTKASQQSDIDFS